MNPAFIISAASLVFCILFFFYFRSFLKRHTAAEELLAEYRTEVYRLIADIDIATDRDSRLVEERIKSLKALLEDTDKRIAVYLRELERSRSGEALYTSLGRGIRAAIGSQPVVPSAVRQSASPVQQSAPPVQQTAPLPESSPVQEQLPAALEAPEAAAASAAVPKKPKASASTQIASAANSTTKRQLGEQIAKLVAQRLSPAEIASQLGISLSEVDLVMNLLNLRKH